MKQTTDEINQLAQQNQWEQIETESIADPALLEAVKLKVKSLVEPICKGEYDVALRRAVFNKMTTLIPLLLPNRKNINSGSPSQQNRTALHYAAANGQDTVISLLIEAGAYVNICDDEGNTPSHFACMNNHPTAATVLAQKGAYAVQNYAGKSPLSLIKKEFASSFAEYNRINQLNAQAKFKKPSIVGTKFKTLGIPGNALLALAVTDSSDTSEMSGVLCTINKGTYDKFTHIASLNEVSHLTVSDYVGFDKDYSDVLPMHLTQMLRRYGSYDNDAVLVAATLLQVNTLLEAAINWNSLETRLKTHFDFVIVSHQLNEFLLKSKIVNPQIQLNEKYYSKDLMGYVLIHSKHFSAIITEAEQQHIALMREKTGLNFISCLRENHDVDATLDISDLSSSEVDLTVSKLSQLTIPHSFGFFNGKKQIVITEANVVESVKKDLPESHSSATNGS